jgi:penicillin-binding protein 2B
MCFGYLLYHIYQIQVIDATWLRAKAEKKWENDKTLVPMRGSITDRNNKVLATDASVYSVSLNPKMLDAFQIADEVAIGLSKILVNSQQDQDHAALEIKLKEKATKRKSDGTFALSTEIRNEGWKIDQKKADEVQSFVASIKEKYNIRGNPGIYLTEEKGRYYPGDTLAAHILGYVNKEGNAVMGLEAKLNDELSGIPGKIMTRTDAKGVEIVDAPRTYQPAINGHHVRLTIDKQIQYYIEEKIREINQEYKPKSISIIAANPMTMEILGLANYPTFNPNQYWTIENEEQFKNQAISSQFEPGSTFKLLTLAGAVEQGLFQPNEKYKSGSINLPGAKLHDHNRIGWGEITYLEGLKRSSNVAFVKLGYEMLGRERLLDYIQRFGFQEKTNIDLASEAASHIELQYPSEIATATYGQGKVVATNIQMATAYAAIANGGKLLRPYVVKDILNADTGEVLESFTPREIRRVVSEETARQVSQYLEQTISDQKIGTGRNAWIEGYRIAGKTGTANKVLPGEKGYAAGKWMVSFTGYAPADNPRILISIMIDEPDLSGNYHLSSSLTTSSFKQIATQSLQYLGVPAIDQAIHVTYKDKLSITNPSWLGLTKEQAIEKSKQLGMKLEFVGSGNQVLQQFPAQDTKLYSQQSIFLFMQPIEQVNLPPLYGKSIREALDLCHYMQASCQTTGSGYVTEQSVADVNQPKTYILKLQPLRDKVRLDF